MKKITLMLAFLFAISWHSDARIYYSESHVSENLSLLEASPNSSFVTLQTNCTSPQASTSIDEDCVNGVYTIDIDVTSMGDATSLTLTNDLGAPDMPVTETGVVSFGPIPAGTVINLVLEHDGDSDCHLDLGSFKDTCPAPNDTIAGAVPITPSAPGTGCDTPTFSYDYGDGSVTDSGLDGSCDGTSTGLDLFYSWTATSPALIWNDGDSNPGIIIRQPDGTEITCESTFASDDTVLSGWNIGDDLIIQIYDFGTAAELVSFCLEELTCPAPSDLVASNITTTEADLSWTSNGGETEWTVIYGDEGFDPLTEGTSIEDNDGNLGVTISGLTASTSYDFYVKANCGPGDESVLAGPASFATQCVSTSSFPLSENFDGNWSGSPAAPLCWTVVNNDNDSYTWTKSASYITPRSGSSTAHGMGNEDDYLISPALDFSATNDMQIRWYDVVESSFQNNTYDVLVSTTNTDVASFTDNLGTFDVTNTEWEEHILDLSAYTGQTIYVAFHQTQSGSSIYGFGIDDVTIEEIPSCLMPENVAVSAPTTTSMDLSWDEEPGATDGYMLYAFAEGADPYSDTPVSTETVAAGMTTGTISGLNSSTFYDFYVVSDCGVEGTSAFSEPAINAATLCDAITTFPLTEDFDGSWSGSPEAPLCWTIVNNDNDSNTWSQSASYITPRSGSYTAHGMGNSDDYLISPALELPVGDPQIVKWYQIVESSTRNNTFEVLVSTTDIQLSSFTDNLGTYDVTSTSWEEQIIDLSAYEGQTIYIAFHQTYSASSIYGFGIDDFSIEQAPSCIKPSGVFASNITGGSADLSWAPTSTETNGYEWYVMAEGDDPDVDTPIETGTTATGVSSVSITGLSETTTYDVYVRTNCSASDVSDYSNLYSFSTICNAFTPDYTEDFTNFPPSCWEQGKGGSFTSGPNSTGSSSWMSDGFLNNGSSGAARINLYTTTRKEWLISPAFDLSADGYEVVFDIGITAYSGSGNSSMGSDDEVYALYSLDGVTWTTMQTWEAGNEPSNSGETVAFDMSGITDTNVRFAIYATDGSVNDSQDYNIYIDNFKVRTQSDCPEVYGLTVSNATVNTVDLSWNEQSNALNGYTLTAFEVGEDPNVDTPIATETALAGETSVTMTGLMPATTYDFYIQADCDANGLSDYAGPVSFSTLCDATNIPFVQDFESVTTPELPNCGTIETIAGNDWQTHNQTSYGFDSNVLRYRYSSSSAADAWYFTRGINLVAGENYQISYQYGNNSTTYTENLKVAFGTSADAASMTENIDDHTISLSGSEVNEVTFTVPADGVYYFGFQAYSDVNEYYLYVDNIEIDIAPTCIAPANVAVSNITTDSADFAWDAEASEVNGYEWYLMAAGEEPEVDTPVQTGTTATGETSVTLTGLTPTTSYDFYVRTDCDTEGMSAFSSTLNFETMLGAVIVTPGTTESGTYCYENNDFKKWLFESSDGSPLTIEFIQGTLETNYSGGTHDDLMIYDGLDDTGVVLYDSDNPTTTAGELAGLIFTAQSGMMYITLDADGSNSCGSGSQTEIIFNVDADVTTGNQDFFSNANFTYYPNPVQSSFEINSTYELEQVVIYNMLGQEVRNISPQSTDVSLDLSDVQAGVYLVKATVKGQTQTFRLIKE